MQKNSGRPKERYKIGYGSAFLDSWVKGLSSVMSQIGSQISYGPPRRARGAAYAAAVECAENKANRALFNEYAGPVCSHLALLEAQTLPAVAMIDQQPEVRWFMRPYLANFLAQMHSSLKLKPQTLFLCWSIIDRYCSKRVVFKKHYQLIGCTALWIAAKYEDKKSKVPTLQELSQMCSNVYETTMFKEMELHILSTLGWNVGCTSLEDILQLAVRYADPDGKERLDQPLENYKCNSPIVSAILAVSRFLAELTIYEKDYLNHSTSILGSSIFILACSILNLDVGTSYLAKVQQQYTMDFQSPLDPLILDDENGFDPNLVTSSFLSNFRGLSTLYEVKQIITSLLESIKAPSDILIEKYTPLGVIPVINQFIDSKSEYNVLLQITKLESQYEQSIPTGSRSSSLTLDSPGNYSSFSSVSSCVTSATSLSFDHCKPDVVIHEDANNNNVRIPVMNTP